MGLLYVNEHINCIHYQNEKPLIKNYFYKRGEIISEELSAFSRLCFVRQGSVNLSINEFQNNEIYSGQFFLIPPSSTFRIEVKEDSDLIVIRFQVQVNLCENFSMTELYDYFEEGVTPEFKILSFTPEIDAYLKLLDIYLKDGINCIHFHEMKKDELFIVLRAYYPKEELAALFYPILNKEDLHFKNFVLEKSLCAKNVQELATMANYSTSGFIKRFSRSFNESPYRWMLQYKADHILHDIYSEDKTLKEIYTKYNFSSMSHFISFCKKQYGKTPGKIRKGRG